MADLLDVTALRKIAAEAEARKAAEERRLEEAEEAKRKALLEELSTPFEVTEEVIARGLQGVATMVQAAAERGHTETTLLRFPNALTTDKGRAINQAEPAWPETLTGRPRQVYAFWRVHLAPKGFKLRAEILDFPGGMPGDVGMILSWGD